MLTPIVLLPLAAVLINDVKAEPGNGAITIDIATSDPVATSDVRIASGGSHRMYVYLDGSAAKRSSFGDASEAIIVYPRQRYTKLEIPTAGRCGEPIGVTTTATGVRVRATCRDGAAVAGTPAPTVHVTTEHPLPAAPRAALTKGGQTNESLRAALALPVAGSADDAVAEGASGDGETRTKAAAARQAKASDSEPPKAALAAKDEAGPKPEKIEKVNLRAAQTASTQIASPAVGGEAGIPSPNANSREDVRPKSGALVTVLAVVLLVGLGVVATMFGRRRIKRERMIRIVETASIGPRRSLVVAAIGGRTMVLGVSEAGVALLDTQVAPLADAAVFEPGATSPVVDAALGLRSLAFGAGLARESKDDGSKHESSLLARLFQRQRRRPDELDRDGFSELFRESLEDEDLRRKLALGEPGRVA